MTRHAAGRPVSRPIGQGVGDESAEEVSQRHAAAHGARDIGGTTAERNIVIFGIGLLTCALLFLIPDLSPPRAQLLSERAHARIVSLPPAADQVAPVGIVQLLDGERRGLQVSAVLEGPTGQLPRPAYQPGDEVLLAIDSQADGTVRYSVIDRWRLPVLGWLIAAFALLTIAIAGWRGLRTLTSLAITVVVVIRVLIPLLLSGYSPVALAVGLGIVISVLSFLMTQGLSRSTAAAIAGTAVGLLVTGALAVVVASAARFTSAQGSEELVVVGQVVGGSIDLSGLLLAAVIFGGLGVVNDVAITQAVTVDELRRLDPSLTRRDLFRRTMSAGTAHLAATVNTLVFAYLGAGLPVLVLLAVQVHALDLAINDEHIAVEVVRAVVGAIGVLSAVPLTTAIAAWWAGTVGSRREPARRLMARPMFALDGPSSVLPMSRSADAAIAPEIGAPTDETAPAEETAPADVEATAVTEVVQQGPTTEESTPPARGRRPSRAAKASGTPRTPRGPRKKPPSDPPTDPPADPSAETG
jgi:uncharacterized membrane protein